MVGGRREARLDPRGSVESHQDHPFAHLWDTARMIAAQGPDVMVTEPPDLREAVIRLLTGARSSTGPGASTGDVGYIGDMVHTAADLPIALDDELVLDQT